MRRPKPGMVIYAASAGEWSKIGVSRDLVWRQYSIRRYAGMRFEIVATWEHLDPFAIETMVKHSLRCAKREGAMKEAFKVPIVTLKREVNWAISAYESYEFDYSSKREELTFVAGFLQRVRAMKCSNNAASSRSSRRRPSCTRSCEH